VWMLQKIATDVMFLCFSHVIHLCNVADVRSMTSVIASGTSFFQILEYHMASGTSAVARV